MIESIRIMGICGSFSLESANGHMINLVKEECKKLGCEVVIWDNEKNPLPFVGEDELPISFFSILSTFLNG